MSGTLTRWNTKTRAFEVVPVDELKPEHEIGNSKPTHFPGILVATIQENIRKSKEKK